MNGIGILIKKIGNDDWQISHNTVTQLYRCFLHILSKELARDLGIK